MAGISTGTGLISGLPTQNIIDQLISIESQPLNDLKQQITANQSKQTALSALSTALLALQSSSSTFASSNVLSARSVTSSNSGLITATATTSAALGQYQFRAVRQASSQRLLSAGYADSTSTPLGAGTITVKLGGFLNSSTSLDQLDGGAGVRRGSIQITDRSGASAVVDLSAARSVDDVLLARLA